jgi:hypothetical protein
MGLCNHLKEISKYPLVNRVRGYDQAWSIVEVMVQGTTHNGKEGLQRDKYFAAYKTSR